MSDEATGGDLKIAGRKVPKWALLVIGGGLVVFFLLRDRSGAGAVEDSEAAGPDGNLQDNQLADMLGGYFESITQYVNEQLAAAGALTPPTTQTPPTQPGPVEVQPVPGPTIAAPAPSFVEAGPLTFAGVDGSRLTAAIKPAAVEHATPKNPELKAAAAAVNPDMARPGPGAREDVKAALPGRAAPVEKPKGAELKAQAAASNTALKPKGSEKPKPAPKAKPAPAAPKGSAKGNGAKNAPIDHNRTTSRSGRQQ